MAKTAKCSICDKSPTRARGYCSMHYERWKSHGDPTVVLKSPRFTADGLPVDCSYVGCDRHVRSRGYCEYHYNRWIATGSPDPAPNPAKGASKSDIYSAWQHVQKSGNVGAPWETFAAFQADVGAKPHPRARLRRQDVNQPWGPGNHLWFCPEERAKTRERGVWKRGSRAENYALKTREAARDRTLRLRFGLGAAEYDSMLAAQNGVCAICAGVEKSGKALAVDHCHATGMVRGLLCTPCNVSLGAMKDDPERLRRAATYLESRRLRIVA